jgi:hypothetical protein
LFVGCPSQAQWATSRAQTGQIAEAIAEVAELTKSPNWGAGQWYDFACVYSLASAKDVKKREEYAARAVELLRRAVEKGYRDADHMAKDAGLDPLRGRADFQIMLAEVQKKAGQK